MKLEKVLTYQKGKSPDKGFISDKQILYLTPEYLRGKPTPNFISDFPSKIEVADGDLLLLWDGSNAGEFFVGKKGVLSSTMVKFNFDELEYNREFLYYQLKSFEGYLKSQTNGSGIPHVNRELLLGLEITKFEKSEQTQIVSILKAIDLANEQTEKLIAKYQRIKSGLMQDLLTKGIDAKGNIRSKTTHKFVVKNGIEVPESWEVIEFNDVANKNIQWSLTGGPFGSNLKAEDYTNSGIRIIQLQNIGVGEFKDDYKIYTSIQKADELISCNIYPNEIILSKMGDPVARACFIPVTEERFLMASDGIRLVPDKKYFDSNFVLTYINYDIFRNAVSSIATGSTRQRIGLTELRKMKFIKPELKEQQHISTLFRSHEELIEQEKENLNKHYKIKTGLMQDFTFRKSQSKIKTRTMKQEMGEFYKGD